MDGAAGAEGRLGQAQIEALFADDAFTEALYRLFKGPHRETLELSAWLQELKTGLSG